MLRPSLSARLHLRIRARFILVLGLLVIGTGAFSERWR